MSVQSHPQDVQQEAGAAPHTQACTRTALCVAVPDAWRSALSDVFRVLDADSAADAVRTLRLMAIDLLVVGADLPDEPFWSLVGRLRRAKPSLAWVLVGDVSDS